jgi:hypothetical protein
MRTRVKLSAAALVLAVIAGLLWFHGWRPTPPRNGASPGASLKAGAPQPPGTGQALGGLSRVSAAKSIPESVRPILGLDGETRAARWAAIGRLGRHLTEAERDALYDYLRGHETDPDGPMRGVLKNDVILALKGQQPHPKRLAGILLAMFQDREQDPVVRNYALQHLATWYDKCPDKSRMVDALWAGTTDADPSIVGTALIGLNRLSEAPDRIDRARLTAVASAMAESESGEDTARITALQVCAEMGAKAVLPVAAKLAGGGGDVPLRVSAVAAVGALGGATELPLLNRLAGAADPRIQNAAHAALRRLQTRPNG